MSVSAAELDRLNERLNYGTLRQKAQAANELAEIRSAVDTDWLVTVHDKFWTPIAAVGTDMMELSGTDPRNDKPTGMLKLKGGSPLVDTMMSCRKTMVGVTVETAGLRFPFYVKSHDYVFEKDELTSTANLVGIWDILNYLIIWPEWFLPIQVQPISHAVFIWALCTVCEAMVSECALRIQSGWMEFINNALSLNPDIQAWFGTLLQAVQNEGLSIDTLSTMLKTPVYVSRTNPLLDTSPLVAKTVRMESCGTVIKDITRAYGVDTRMDLWLPGDPQPDQWANLTHPTYVFSTKDRSQITGPTGTVLDSVVRTVVDAGGSFGGIFNSIVTQVPGMDGVFEAPLLGVNYAPPWAVGIAPEPGKKGSVETYKITDHTPEGWQHIIGGRSPKWLNDLMNATFAWMIDSISILIGFTGIPSNLLEGFLNNAFLAFQLIQVYDVRNEVGPYHPAIERFYPTASAPYNIETFFAFINAIFDARGYTSAIVTMNVGGPNPVYTLGKDIFKGGLFSLLYHARTKLLTDYIENVMFRITPSERTLTIQIGDGKKDAPPLAKIQALITGTIEAANTLTLAPQS